MTHSTEISWVVLVPVKRGDIGKSRLGGVTARQRADLARAFPADCTDAALAARPVRAVVAVTDDATAARTLRDLGAEVIPDEPDAGLNPALLHARDYVRDRYDDPPVAVLSGDLPALRSDELARALRRAERFARSFLPDRAGEGTTLLAAGPGVGLDPRFGANSRHRHAQSGAHEIDRDGLASVRLDVDTADDLDAAIALGVGRHTRAVLQRHGLGRDVLH